MDINFISCRTAILKGPGVAESACRMSVLFLQSQFEDVSDADLKKMDVRIGEINSEVQTISQSCRQLDTGVYFYSSAGKRCVAWTCTTLGFGWKFMPVPTELKELNSSLTTAEMKAQIQELQAECSGYRERLENIKSATNHVTPEEREKVWISLCSLMSGDHCLSNVQCKICLWMFFFACQEFHGLYTVEDKIRVRVTLALLWKEP